MNVLDIKRMPYETMVNNIRLDLKNYILNYDLKSLVIGVSGGLDSAVCCALARPVCDELSIELIGMSISIESNKLDELKRAHNIGRTLCSTFKEIDLTFSYHAEIKEIETMLKIELSNIAKGNLKARKRMKYLYLIAGENKGMVLSTDNLTEYLLGFWTLHGDVGDYGMIQNLWKTEVYELAHYLSLKMDCVYLLDCVEAIPTDGLGITNSDLDQIWPDWEKEFENCRKAYKAVDNTLREYFHLKSFTKLSLFSKISPDMFEITKHPVIQRHLSSEYKRNNPYNIPRNEIF